MLSYTNAKDWLDSSGLTLAKLKRSPSPCAKNKLCSQKSWELCHHLQAGHQALGSDSQTWRSVIGNMCSSLASTVSVILAGIMSNVRRYTCRLLTTKMVNLNLFYAPQFEKGHCRSHLIFINWVQSEGVLPKSVLCYQDCFRWCNICHLGNDARWHLDKWDNERIQCEIHLCFKIDEERWQRKIFK